MIAPFVPFMSEDIYQNLVRSVDQTAPESVHLCRFPTADESMIDEKMNAQMDALLGVISLGRACRNAASLKVRQPLKTLYVKGTHFDEAYVELAKDELNVKQVVFYRRRARLYHLHAQAPNAHAWSQVWQIAGQNRRRTA